MLNLLIKVEKKDILFVHPLKWVIFVGVFNLIGRRWKLFN